MKKLLGGAMLLAAGMFSLSAYANPADSCDGEQTIFDAYAVKGCKHVGVCYVAGNIRYVYGKDSGKPDLLLNVPADKVNFTLSGNGDQSVTIPNGDYSYTVGESLRGGSSIQVWKQQKLISEIELNGETLENHIEKFSSNSNNYSVKTYINNAVTLNVSGQHQDFGPARVYMWKYQLISNIDNIQIQKITINNGNCNINRTKTREQEKNIMDSLINGSLTKLVPEVNEKPLNWNLNMGDVHYFTVYTDSGYGKCRPREALIETNKGISTFRWKN